MSLGTFTIGDEVGTQPSAPTFTDRVSFLGDNSYPTGGTATFSALFQAKTKDGRKPIAVIAQDCGGYVVAYDETNDKLKVFRGAHTVDNPMSEVPNATDLSGVTFNVIVISK